jgi:hypothetical protein
VNIHVCSDVAPYQVVNIFRCFEGKYFHLEDCLTTYYLGADKSLAPPTSRCILFDGENISFDASLVIYINSTNIPPIMIINRIYEHQNLLSL